MKNIIFISLLITLFACKTQKPILKQRAFRAITTQDFYDSIVANYTDYKSFYTKFSAQSEIDGKSTSIKGTIKIERDSVIWISITPLLGTEVFRISITKDSVQFVNRLEREYYSGDYKYLSQLTGLNINFDLLEDILMNQFFFYPISNIDTVSALNEFEISKDPKVYKIHNLTDKEYKKMQKQKIYPNFIYHSYKVNKYNLHLDNIEFNDFKYRRNLSVDYDDFIDFGNNQFPSIINININDRQKNIIISIEYYKSEFDKDNSYNFSISSKYKKIIER